MYGLGPLEERIRRRFLLGPPTIGLIPEDIHAFCTLASAGFLFFIVRLFLT